MFSCCWKTSGPSGKTSILNKDKITLTVLLSSIDAKELNMNQKKSEFWETQVQGKKEVWDALKVIAEAESLDLANAIITSLNLSIAHSDYHLEFKVWDEYGDEYIVPAWVYSPSKVEKDETQNIQIVPRDPDTSIRVRLSTGAQDVKLRVHRQDPIFTIIQKLLETLQDKNVSIKLFYLGKILEVHRKIIEVLPNVADQEIIIQAMILSK